MNDVSLLRFINMLSPGLQDEVLALVHELELQEFLPYFDRSLGSGPSCRQSLGIFAADLALQAHRDRPIFRPYYKPDLSAFEPFYQQLDLFSL